MPESGERSCHQANGDEIDHGFTTAGCAFIIFTQATVMSQPGEKPLTNPAFWQDLKSLLIGRFFHNFHDEGQPAADPFHNPVFIALIRKDLFEAARLRLHINSQFLRRITVLDRGRRNQHQQQEAQRIDQTMAFTAFHLFGAIKAALFPSTGGFDALTIQNASTRFWVAIKRNPDVFAQVVIDLLQGTIVRPRPKIIIDGIPRGQIVRQHPPLTAGSGHIAQRVDHFAQINFALPSWSWFLSKQWGQTRPFRISQIGWVWPSRHDRTSAGVSLGSHWYATPYQRSKIKSEIILKQLLITGLQYVKDAQPDTVARLIKKFNKDIDYAEKAFPDYTRVYMLWSPIVKASAPNAKHDQMKAVEEICTRIREERGIEIELIINEKYKECLLKLREYAAKKTAELKSPVLRLFQIEALLDKHLELKTKKASKEQKLET